MGSMVSSRMEAGVHTMRDQVIGFQAQQREVQMAIGMAQTRDLLQYIFGVWTGFAAIGVLATAKHRKFPAPLAIPLLVLPIVGGYQYDFAYHNKLRRVTQEAEHILEHERFRFIPPKQAPFSGLYEEEAKNLTGTPFHGAGRVGSYWPEPIRAWLEGPNSSQ